MRYAEIILPLRLPWHPVYAIGDGVHEGDRVKVTFAGKEYTGVVWHADAVPSVGSDRIQEACPEDTGLLPVTPREMRFWEFISDYYLCSIGEVYKSAYPLSRTDSEKTARTISQRAEAARRKRIEALERRIGTLEGRIRKYDADLSGKTGEKRHRAEDELHRASAALDALRPARAGENGESAGDNGESADDGRIAPLPSRTRPPKPTVLFSSMRSGSYVSAIRDAVSCGRQALVLTPEKAFLDRLLNVLEEEFPGKVAVYSSDGTPAARRRVSERTRKENLVVLGTRSALFLPFHDLGLIIVDEEQDTFYKQTEPNPRYNGRDAAVMLATIHGSEVILGTSSPSLETWYNCSIGKYSMQCGPVFSSSSTVDVNAERRKNGMIGPVSRKLVRAILGTSGPSVIIRGWERPEDLDFGKLCPGASVRVMTMQEFKREGPSGAVLVGVLQADAFVGRDDFRADERAMQLTAQLSSMVPEVVVQTSVPDRFAGARTQADLLAERKAFRYPPYSRIVDINVRDSNEGRLSSVCDRLSEILEARPLATGPGERKFRFFMDRSVSHALKKRDMAEAVSKVQKEFRYSGHIIIDVDPQD